MASFPNVQRLADRRRKRKALPFAPEQVWVDRAVANHPQTLRILNRLAGVRVDVAEDLKRLKRPMPADEAKRQLLLTAHRGAAFKPCQGIGPGHRCCDYRVIDLVSGCPMACSYCILQSYLANNPMTTVAVNLEEILGEVSAFLDAHPQRTFRIGTGELGDSLALDPILDFASILVPFFAGRKNAIFELKTKSAFVDGLLDLRHEGRTVIAWSLNTPAIVEHDERGTATLDERFSAAAKAAAAGYRVAFHFDPIVLITGSREEIAEYEAVIDRLFAAVEPHRIAWVSLGLLRYPPDLPQRAREQFPETRLYTGELVPTGDKMRYPRFIRQAAYKPLWEKLTAKLSPHKVYLCMETQAVWDRIDPTVQSNRCIEKRLASGAADPFSS